MNRYLAQLVKVLSGSSGTSESIKWGNELENLPPSAYSILNSNEPLPVSSFFTEEPSSDHEYYKSLASVLSGFSAAVKVLFILSFDGFVAYYEHEGHIRFRTRPKDTEWPKTCHDELLLPLDESTAIQNAVENYGFTLTHLAHAALAMVVIFDNPPNRASSAHFMNSVSLANFRSQLDPNHCALHPGNVLGVFMTRIPASAFLSSDGSVLPFDRDMLLRVAEIAKGQCLAHEELPTVLSTMPQVGEVLASATVQAAFANMLLLNQCFSFLNDGEGEKYLNCVFEDDAGKTVLEAIKFFTSLTRFDPGP
ncbi:hypothetical protein CY34DRAFT_16503 [Suillus luteus UH-Slu-Lm8-n1]|uniref:Uncharacterized protein n=1 Tax=Suillus luteus UH-Slu-Lm8-n1 TaxID=930992 RepID=A0A0D0ADP8_9AGAM|nr:hypothetical protein CY34DRAFT_16503 [Suillus luteus UH-Slu-Lm8-n1]